MNKAAKPLYRKVNTKTWNVHHDFGSSAKYDRHSKRGLSKSMKQGIQRGLDYTPLYKFLLSKVGEDWDAVYSEAVKRLDKKEPIFYLVAQTELDKKPYVRCGESSYYSGLFVDENNRLQKVDPSLKNEDMTPTCGCCTHTFNGERFVRKYGV